VVQEEWMRVEVGSFGHIHRGMEKATLILQRTVSGRRFEEIEWKDWRKSNCRAANELSFEWPMGLGEQWSAIVRAWISRARLSCEFQNENQG
jgi:hypothetical protein